MPSQVFTVVEAETDDDLYVIISGNWFRAELIPGFCNPPDEFGLPDYQDDYECAWHVSEAPTNVTSAKMYQVEAVFAHEGATDWMERDIAEFCLFDRQPYRFDVRRL